MKFAKITTLLLLLSGCFTVVSAQKLHFANITNDGEKLNNIPRFSIGFPFTFDLADLGEKALIHGGGTIKTEGVNFNIGEDKKKIRTWTVGPVVNLILKQKKTFILLGYGADYNFHYKERLFPNNQRQNLEILHTEWNSDRVNRFNHYVRLGFGSKTGAYIYGEYFFNEYMNQDFTETIDNVEVMPYKGLEINRFNIGISFILIQDGADDDDDEKKDEKLTGL